MNKYCSAITQETSKMKRVLIVEDEQLLNSIYSSELKEEGYETVNAFDGRTALSLLQERKPDIVVLDIKLPDMSGLQVLESLRKDNPHLPVIICSAYDAEKSDFSSNINDITGYLVKPIKLEDLINKIQKMLEK